MSERIKEEVQVLRVSVYSPSMPTMTAWLKIFIRSAVRSPAFRSGCRSVTASCMRPCGRLAVSAEACL